MALERISSGPTLRTRSFRIHTSACANCMSEECPSDSLCPPANQIPSMFGCNFAYPRSSAHRFSGIIFSIFFIAQRPSRVKLPFTVRHSFFGFLF